MATYEVVMPILKDDHLYQPGDAIELGKNDLDMLVHAVKEIPIPPTKTKDTESKPAKSLAKKVGEK